MDRFRVLSDIHCDKELNGDLPLGMKGGDEFAVVCGDIAGDTDLAVEWLKANVRRGVFVSGNHLPYSNAKKPLGEKKLMSELREGLSAAFPACSDVTYLDAETGVVSKEVDGILFIGSCTYTDMRVSHPVWNKNGDRELNCRCSEWNLNDYVKGYVARSWPLGSDNDPTLARMSAKDYVRWHDNAIAKMDEVLSENEDRPDPLPAVVITHHPLVTDFLGHNGYVEDGNWIQRQREFNWASYASDRADWLKSHPSVRCHCCGHIHDVYPEYRSFDLVRGDGSKILVVNNARGYSSEGHDLAFNANRFVRTSDWTLEEIPKTEEELAEEKKRADRLWKSMAWFM